MITVGPDFVVDNDFCSLFEGRLHRFYTSKSDYKCWGENICTREKSCMSPVWVQREFQRYLINVLKWCRLGQRCLGLKTTSFKVQEMCCCGVRKRWSYKSSVAHLSLLPGFGKEEDLNEKVRYNLASRGTDQWTRDSGIGCWYPDSRSPSQDFLFCKIWSLAEILHCLLA